MYFSMYLAMHFEINSVLSVTTNLISKCILCIEYVSLVVLHIFLLQSISFRIEFLTVLVTCSCSVFKADIYYHNECMTKYMYEYDPRCKDTTPKLTPTQRAWYHGYQVVPELERRLTNGKGYELGCIRHT